jgi:hypothetical protein
VTSITTSKATTASVKHVLGATSRAGRLVLREAGLTAMPFLRASQQPGVLVFAGHPAFAASAHSARRSHSRS